MNDNITEYNHNTGETIIREMTDEEQKKIESVMVEANLHLENVEQQKAQKALATNKLLALGLTADDLKALGL